MAEHPSGLGQTLAPGLPDPNQAIEALLRHLAPELADAIRLSAIPHSFDAGLLGALRGAPEGAGDLLAALQRSGFVTEIAPARFAYHSSMRSYLLGQAQQDLPGYRQINARASAFFDVRLNRGESPDSDSDRLEQIYHLLAADEDDGLLLLRRAFEAAYGAYNLGLAEQLLDYAQEQQPVLSDIAWEWLQYYQAQLDHAFGQPAESQATFRALAESAHDPLLKGQATRSLAESLVLSHQWEAAIDQLRAAQQIFERLGLAHEIARTQNALGSAYVNLAEATGGLRPEIAATANRAERWWHTLRLAPFLIYRWFSRRVSILPNLYLGTDYQNWLVIGYLYRAIHWFDRARATLAQPSLSDLPEVQLTCSHTQIRLADLWFRIGCWSRAEKLFASLSTAPPVVASPYLTALIRVGQGRGHLARGDIHTALDEFGQSLTIFEQYGDHAALANTHRLLAEAKLRLGDRGASSDEFAAASEIFYQVSDLVNATEALAEARALVGLEENAPPGSRIADLETHLQRRAYTARFPGPLHRLFRRIAAYIALPLAYIFVGVFAVDTIFDRLISLIEFGVRTLPYYATQLAAIGDVFLALSVLLILFFGGLWLYELLYVAAGLVVARRLSLSQLVAEQPVYYVTDESGLSQYDGRGQIRRQLAWAEVTSAASFDRGFTRTPLALFSRCLVSDTKGEIFIEGIVNRYPELKRVIIEWLRRQASPVMMQNYDYYVLDTAWFLPALAAIFAVAAVNFFDWLDVTQRRWNVRFVRSPSGVRHPLYLAGFLSGFLDWLVYAGPIAVLLHLLHNHRRIRRAFPHIPPEPDWPIWVALVFFLAITLGKLYMLTE